MYYTTSIPGLLADITVTDMKKGKVKAIAVGINPEDGSKYAELGAIPSKVVSMKRKQYAISEAKTKLEKLYLERYGLGTADESAMLVAFSQVKKAVLAGELRLVPTWKHLRTNTAVITFFEKNTLPLILPYADSSAKIFLPSDREEIESILIEAAKRRKREDDSDVGDKAVNRLHEADIVYSHMRDKDERLPDLKFSPDGPSARAPKKEQVKALPRGSLMKFFARLHDLIEDHPREVFFAVFVVYGLRPAEAAARKPSDIQWHDTFCVAEVKSQEQGGKLNPRLKNEYSRRLIIISYWGMSLLKLCCEVIGEDYPHDDHAMNNAVACSRWVKELLVKCGCDENTIEEEGASIDDDDLDTEDTQNKISEEDKKQKIACYVLRRVFATNCRSIMGLTSFETDRLLGHIPIGAGGKKENKQGNPDMNSIDTQEAIAAKMERYIHDSRYSLNPSVTPYTVSANKHIDVIEYSEVIIVNETDHSVSLALAVDGAETGEAVAIEMPLGTEHKLTHISMPKSWDGYDRTVIGCTTIPKG